jgi:hypothetical protein
MHCSFIPREVTYLTRFDDFKKYLENIFDMPDKMVALVIRFLEQNNGRFSERAKEKEFTKLTKDEIEAIEDQYQKIFMDNQD